MTRQERYTFIIDYFSKHLPEAETELRYSDPFQLLVAVILSAQCTDKRVNLVTPELFKAFPNSEVLGNSSPEEVYHYIRSISYPNNKAKHLVKMGKILTEKFNGVVPSTINELQELPGVGRKTANVITSVIFNQPAMAVDTHVFRVAARIELTLNAKNPLAAEIQLIRYIPMELIPKAHHWLILHGRYICIARKPKCEVCGISSVCKYFTGKRK